MAKKSANKLSPNLSSKSFSQVLPSQVRVLTPLFVLVSMVVGYGSDYFLRSSTGTLSCLLLSPRCCLQKTRQKSLAHILWRSSKQKMMSLFYFSHTTGIIIPFVNRKLYKVVRIFIGTYDTGTHRFPAAINLTPPVSLFPA